MTERRAVGRGAAVTPTEAQEIRLSHVVDGKSISAISRETGRTRETISNILKTPDTEALRQSVQEELHRLARTRLQSGVVRAADAWLESLDTAAEKGNHRPAKDLLESTGVIEPTDAGVSVSVSMIGVGNGVFLGSDGHHYEIPQFPPGTPIEQVVSATPVRCLPASAAPPINENIP